MVKNIQKEPVNEVWKNKQWGGAELISLGSQSVSVVFMG